MNPEFEHFLNKISNNNDMMMDAIRWNAESFQKQVEKKAEARSGTQNTS